MLNRALRKREAGGSFSQYEFEIADARMSRGDGFPPYGGGTTAGVGDR